ncbi:MULTISPECIES: phosphate acetyltransferase [Clostridium]|uniref:Phosphate acetyltransferase n=2 Tax=Clostridium TaxID=1485 RepID=M1MFB8_9CLOT|nr:MULTISPECIES: phosphate acetyltransferase [Clostridium]AGF55073.1 phosphate acetyltransferase Pta [Clostridium saccharoperbutylacetonicum N1-4(HMT)]AQR93962.1 phosphate acetyltransferase [Clostridium saccharoperbutylacetonicum]MBC2478617.1 phosphate acetyltransferase [Clostridium beijerinckii]NRT64218.1 phosphate acetyltransferase [Clostridium saccharoperbutylacetonicum]NSB27585.1 phosphate acetyltransferase [Clostridium saccharoperbutylacetonicum]
MDLMKKIWAAAQSDKRRIVLPEGNEERNIEAAGKIQELGLAYPILIGGKDEIEAKAKELDVDLSGIEIIDPEKSENLNKYITAFYELRKSKGVTMEKADKIVRDPLYFATMMVKLDDADGMVSGAVHTTGDLLRPGLQIIKTAPGVSVVSSFFIMQVPGSTYGEQGTLIFSDCAVNPNPNEDQLAAIAIATAETAKRLCNMDPKVAMLSFSTMGSADNELVDKVRNATQKAKEMRPDLDIDGELQLDAAIVKKVADQKAPNSKVAGKANVLVFPDLQAGNIGYKLVQRFANAEAIGPICQGFDKPINDLSRGCSSDDIVNVVALTAVQAQNNK